MLQGHVSCRALVSRRPSTAAVHKILCQFRIHLKQSSVAATCTPKIIGRRLVVLCSSAPRGKPLRTAPPRTSSTFRVQLIEPTDVQDAAACDKLLVYLPGTDGTGQAILPQIPALRKLGYDVWCLYVPPDDRSDWEQLTTQVTLLLRQLLQHWRGTHAAEAGPAANGGGGAGAGASAGGGGGGSRRITIVAESFGGCLALRLAASGAGPELLDRLVLVNPATSFNRSLSGLSSLIAATNLLSLFPRDWYALAQATLLPLLVDGERVDAANQRLLQSMVLMEPPSSAASFGFGAAAAAAATGADGGGGGRASSLASTAGQNYLGGGISASGGNGASSAHRGGDDGSAGGGGGTDGGDGGGGGGTLYYGPAAAANFRANLLREGDPGEAALRRVAVPVLLITSARDRLLPSILEGARLERCLPRSRRYILPDSGHAALLERGVDLAEIMRAAGFAGERPAAAAAAAAGPSMGAGAAAAREGRSRTRSGAGAAVAPPAAAAGDGVDGAGTGHGHGPAAAAAGGQTEAAAAAAAHGGSLDGRPAGVGAPAAHATATAQDAARGLSFSADAGLRSASGAGASGSGGGSGGEQTSGGSGGSGTERRRRRERAAAARSRSGATGGGGGTSEDTAEEAPAADVDSAFDEWCQNLAPWRDVISPVVLGFENLPPPGSPDFSRPMLFVGNHQKMGFYDTPLLVYELYVRGYRVRGLAHAGHWTGPFGAWFESFGAVKASPLAAFKLLKASEKVLLFPGGAKEVVKKRGQEYTLLWKDSPDFVRLAARCDALIVPFAAVGADDAYDVIMDTDEVVSHPVLGPLTRGLLGRVSSQLDPQESIFPITRLPVVGLPTPIPVPNLQRLYFRFAPPVDPRALATNIRDPHQVQELYDGIKATVTQCMAELLEVRQGDEDSQLGPRLSRSLQRLVPVLGAAAAPPPSPSPTQAQAQPPSSRPLPWQ